MRSTRALLPVNYATAPTGVILTVPYRFTQAQILSARLKQLGLSDTTTIRSKTTPTIKSTYGSSSVNLYDNKRSRISVHSMGVSSYAPDPVADDAVFDDVIIDGIQELSRERVHLTQSTAGEKIYAFGREHRLFSVSAILIDTYLTRPIKNWDGRGLNKWKTFYEKYARLVSCARDARVVVFRYQDRIISGAVTEYTLNSDCNQPGIYQLTFVFYVQSVATVTETQTAISTATKVVRSAVSAPSVPTGVATGRPGPGAVTMAQQVANDASRSRQALSTAGLDAAQFTPEDRGLITP